MRIISGSARGRKLLEPKSMVTRPTLDRVKESIFNIIQNRVYGAAAIDCFSGTGSLGLEAASRGAKEVFLIDRSPETFPLLKQNILNLAFEDTCTALNGDSYEITRNFGKKGKKFDLVFIDPPYAKEMIPPMVEIVDEYGMLQQDGIIVSKIDSGEEIFEGTNNIKLYDHRRYGNTTVCFYRWEKSE